MRQASANARRNSSESRILNATFLSAMLEVYPLCPPLGRRPRCRLAGYAWIFPNVVTHGHWWYSNAPAFLEGDLAARLETVPATKQIG